MIAFNLSCENGKLKHKFKLIRDPKWKVSRPTICGPLD